ncbi:estradiol 17-beta-dehydrogenase 12-B [Eremomyces bilateralis CBS 781.70]|uniref:Very-long-chain 3-oxoacyl-CoA reductase n=1 Tax=Eremomyces bilateralis CBS 781.70 TaxID=1392243 RepID=A0A6G1G2N6_9PEZI|nr:estradiol 17-beta-dehydrogenase 12-B [Eremomyces bilateralis CBS 781.70]KAF1812069.1 estradiol 17-beta-dehydrogenase 12-B [Eremomyces bilateralis CBS 781.70]
MDFIEYASSPAIQVFAVIGLVYISAKILSYLRLLGDLFILPGTSLRTFGPKGSWAVITGASDGIGKEFANQLAKAGFNVFLVSRTKSKLDDLATDIARTYNVQTATLAIDFSAATDADYRALAAQAAPLDVAILVNNVGQSHSIPVPFIETDRDELENIININCHATLRVTQALTPAMVQRKRGLILTMASFAGVFPTPLLATYSGSKAFLQAWSAALGAELAPAGVTVQCVQSHLVVSAMSKLRRTTMMVPSTRTFVRATLRSIGRAGGSQGSAYQMTPYWSHAVMQWGIETLVGARSGVVLAQNKTMHEAVRKRALRKREREAKKQ